MSGRELKFLCVGFVVAAVLPALAAAATSPSLGADFERPSTVLQLAAMLYVPSLLFTLLFGFPYFAVARSFGRISWWSVTLAGFLSGSFFSMSFTGFRLFQPGWFMRDASSVFLTGVVGAASAVLAWVFWRAGAQPTVPSDANASRHLRG